MKTMKKIIMIVLMTAALMLTVSSCGGVKIDDIKGDWTVSTVNGKPVAEYTDSYEYANYKVTDKSFVYSGINADGSPVTSEYAIKMTDKGFEASSGSSVINVVYDAKAVTLSFDSDGKSIVLKKGTSTLAITTKIENEEPVLSSSEKEEDKNIEQYAVDDEEELFYETITIEDHGSVEEGEIFDELDDNIIFDDEE